MLWRNLIGQVLTLGNRRPRATAALAPTVLGATAALALVAALTGLGAAPARATPGDILYVEADDTALRGAPEAAAPVVLRLEAGHKLIEFERRGDWVRVGVFGAVGKVGWLRRDLAARRKAESAGLDLPEIARGTGAAQPIPSAPAPPASVEAPTPSFRLALSGSPALRYAGECDRIGADGRSRRRKLAGLVPTAIEFRATALRCRIRKQDFRGRLRAVLSRGGVTVATAETTAPFNHVEVRSAGPWGRAAGLRGRGIVTHPLTIAPEARGRILPPLTGPIVPPLTAPMIPRLMGPTTRPPVGALPAAP